VGSWLPAVVSFAYLIFRHLSRKAVKADGLDDSTLLMVLVVKLYTLCYNLYDAQVTCAPGEEARLAALAKGADKRAARAAAAALRLLPEQQARAIAALPNPLEFLGYVFNFPTVIVGPAFEMGEYLAAQRRASAPAARVFPALWKFLQGVAYLGVYATIAKAFPLDGVYAEAVRPGATFASAAAALVLALLFSRYQYYAPWKLVEGAAVLCGFGYREASPARKCNPAVEDFEAFTGWDFRGWAQRNLTPMVDSLGLGIKGLPDWEGACNVNVISVETRVSFKNTIDNWNMHTQSWLARYIFVRVPEAWQPKFVTFLASAFWHGCVGGLGGRGRLRAHFFSAPARHSRALSRAHAHTPRPPPSLTLPPSSAASTLATT
jgi:lysophospholipid acyltransferase